MVNYTQTLDESVFASLLEELETLSEAVKNVREKLLKMIPAKVGSDLWWEKSDKKGSEDYQRGKYITLKNKIDIDNFFKNL